MHYTGDEVLKMLFTTLINQISVGNSVKIIHSADLFDIKDIALIDGSCAEYRNSTLYFGYFEQLPDGKLPPQCVLARTPASEALKSSSSSLALVDCGELFLAVNAAKTAVDESRESGFYGELMDCAARSGNLEPVVNLAASKLGNSVVLLDTDYKVLVHSTIYPIDDPLWAQNIAQGYCSYEFVNAVQKLDSVKNAQPTSDPVVVTCYASPLRKLSSKIFIHKKLVGIVLMLEKETPISTAHMLLLPVISAATGDVIARYAPYMIPGNTAYQKLLYDLLIGAPPSQIAPQCVGLQFSPHLCALCIRQARYLGQRHLKEDVAAKLVYRLPQTWFTFHENGIAALVPLGDALKLPVEQRQILEDLASGEYLRIGVSNAFFSPENFARRYVQARRALDLSGQLQRPDTVCYYADYSFYDLLDSYGSPETLGLFCHPALSVLSRYDHDNGMNLYHTLEAYLQCDCSVKDTAQKLFIHRNTLNYRLERIQALTQIDLGNSNLRFLLAMSYRIDHFTGRDF